MDTIHLLLKWYYKLPFRPLRKPLAFLFNKYRAKDLDKTVQVSRRGVTFELQLRDRVASGIYYDFYEPVITSLFETRLREGDVVLDVGANLGYYSLLSARLVGKTGRVYAFEPMSHAFARLRRRPWPKKQ